MPFHLVQNTYSKEAVQAMAANPQDRSEAVAKLMEAAGGKLHHMFFAFGEWDTVMLCELPDDKAAAGAVMAAASTGSTGEIRTTKLLPMAEAMDLDEARGNAHRLLQAAHGLRRADLPLPLLSRRL